MVHHTFFGIGMKLISCNNFFLHSERLSQVTTAEILIDEPWRLDIPIPLW